MHSYELVARHTDKAAEPTCLFEMHASVINTRNRYVVDGDGQRFLVNQVLDIEDAPINVIANWMAAIK